MIEKFITIKNVGKYRDCSASGDVALRRLNLIYAENGRGKTTLCALLRSLQSGPPTAIVERKTLAGAGEPSVRVLHAGQTIAFTNGAWSRAVPDLAIFDSEFVHQNVYVGDSVEHEQNKNLYRVITRSVSIGVRLAKLRLKPPRGGTSNVQRRTSRLRFRCLTFRKLDSTVNKSRL